MRLQLSQIQNITLGAVRVEQQDDGIHFYRFTKAQEELYQTHNPDFYVKTFATAGVRLRFKTDSRTLGLKAMLSKGSSRTYFAFDVTVDGAFIGSLDNVSDIALPQNYTTLSLPLGAYGKTFELGEGEKEITVYFPWSVCAVLNELSVDDGATVIPVKAARKVLFFGDSITQGYDVLHPSKHHTHRIADMLNAEGYNKAIGGEEFFPALAAEKDELDPDLITVAYGTNDWNGGTAESFKTRCRSFFKNLAESYPNTKIVAITPIWRKDMNEYRRFGVFESVDELIRSQTAEFSNVTVIRGFEFVPQDEKLYADLRLHPNDTGFDHYAEHLITYLKTER